MVAWELAQHGWDVTILERGRNLRPGLGKRPSDELGTQYGSDEIKGVRGFGFPDGNLEPYTTRTQAEAAQGVARSASGALGQLGAAVGGTSLHYNAKTPRFWKQDFHQRSALGPVDGAQVADWPITYDDLEPFYDEVEHHVGVQGDRSKMPKRTLRGAPRRRDFVMGPNPIGYAASLVGQGAELLGFEPYPFPAAVNSRTFQGRPACNSCGFCSGFGCPINARGDALVSYLNPALRTGRVRVIDRAWVHRVQTSPDGRRATGVLWRDVKGREHRTPARTVILAGSPINTARLLLLSANGKHPRGLGNRSDQVGRNMMFHNFTQAAAFFPRDVKPLRAAVDDAGRRRPGRSVHRTRGLRPRRALHRRRCRAGRLRRRAGAGGPDARRHHRLRAAAQAGAQGRAPRRHRRFAAGAPGPAAGPQPGRPRPEACATSWATRRRASPTRRTGTSRPPPILLGARLEAMHALAPGATGAIILPFPLLGDGITYTAHLAGTARMGDDPRTSVCAPSGRMHELDNVYVADASTWPTYPGFNPTLTIMANAQRIARRLATRPGE